jgi:uncharacterized protein YjdB
MPSFARLRPLVFVLGVTLAWSCSTDQSGIRRLPLEPNASLRILTVSPGTTTLTWLGAEGRLTAQVQASDGTIVSGFHYSWRSLDPAVVTVDTTGAITAMTEGTAEVVVALMNLADTANVTVKRIPASIQLSPDSVLLTTVNATRTVTATVLDGGGEVLADATVAWRSSDSTVVTVSADGTLKAGASGQATVTATSGTVSRTMKVRVSLGAHSVTVVPSSVSMDALGDTVTLQVTVKDIAGNVLPNPQVSFQSADPSVATVTASGRITSVGVGATHVVVRGDTVVANVDVEVTQTPTQVRVTPDSVTLIAGTSVAFAAAVEDRTGHAVSGQTVTWTSSDPMVATLTSAGVATAVAPGSTWIVAGLGTLADSARLTVTAQGVSTVVVTPDSINVLPGSTAALSVKFYDGLGSELTGPVATWSSRDPTVATVNGQGVVTGVGSGTTWVRATAGSAADSSKVVVPPSAFNIVLQYAGSVAPDATVQAAFESAKAEWEKVLVGDLSDTPVSLSAGQCGVPNPAFNQIVDDVVIFAVLDSLDGDGNVLGQGGPCIVRTTNGLPVVGVVQLDTADIATAITYDVLTAVVTHEMGHALGYGTASASLPWDQILVGKGGADPYWPGSTAVARYVAANGTAIHKVPVEAGGGAGTRDVHWRESDMGIELMTGYLNTDIPNPLSAVSVGAMQDMGYVVNLAAADPYVVNAALRVAGSGHVIELKELPLPPPLGVTPDGRIVRFW